MSKETGPASDVDIPSKDALRDGPLRGGADLAPVSTGDSEASAGSVDVELLRQLLREGQAATDYRKRAQAAAKLAESADSRALSEYSTVIARALYDWLNRVPTGSEQVFAKQYSDPDRLLGESLTQLVSMIAESAPTAISEYVPLLVGYLHDERGRPDYAVLALEAIADTEPDSITADDITWLFSSEDCFVVATGARLLHTLVDNASRKSLCASVDLSRLNRPLRSEDPDICGAAAECLATVAEAGYESRVVAQLDLGALETPLQTGDEYPQVNSTALLSALVVAGFELAVLDAVGVEPLNSALSGTSPDAAGNAAIVLSYIADTDEKYGTHIASTVDVEALAGLVGHESQFVSTQATPALAFIAEHGVADQIADAVDSASLAEVVRADDATTAGNAMSLLNELIDQGATANLAPEFPFESVTIPLTHPDDFPKGNAASTVGYLAEHGYGSIAVEVIDMSLLTACLTDSRDRVCGGAAGSIADLAEFGFADAIAGAVTVENLCPLVGRADPYVCGNAVLALGHLAVGGYSNQVEASVSATDLARCLHHEDDDVAEYAGQTIAALAVSGYSDPVIECSGELHDCLARDRRAGTAGVLAAVSYLIREQPVVLDREACSALFEHCLRTASTIDLMSTMEIDPREPTLGTLVAEACNAVAEWSPTKLGPEAESLVSIADQGGTGGGRATSLLIDSLYRLPSKSAIP